MNAYFALSAIFMLGLRGINKKLKLEQPPITHFTPEDRKNGKVSPFPYFGGFLDFAVAYFVDGR
jgi:glutamine synthetase